PAPLRNLLREQPRIVEDPLVERQMAAVCGHVDSRHPRERGKEVLLRERIVDGPERLTDAAGARAAARLVREPGHVELRLGRLLAPRGRGDRTQKALTARESR